MIRWLRSLFCAHKWDQRYWGGAQSGYLCLKCDRIQYRKGAGGPPPAGVSFGPPSNGSSAND